MAIVKGHTIQPQFDGSEIEKGFKAMEKRYKDLAKISEPTTGKKALSSSKSISREEARRISSMNTFLKHRKNERLDEEAHHKKQRVDYQKQAKEEVSAILNRRKLQDANSQRELQNTRRLEKARRRIINSIKDEMNRIDLKTKTSSSAGMSDIHPAMQRMGAQKGRYSALLGEVSGGGFSLKSIDGVNDKLRQMKRSGAQAKHELAGVTREMRKQSFVAQSLGDSLRNLGRSYLSLFAVVAGGVAMYRIGEQLEQVRASLLAVSGDTDQVAKDWEYISSRAIGLGQDLTTMAKGYQQIGIAAKTMGFSVDQGRHIFMASAEAATAFNLSVDDSSGVMRAFTQMLSKGKVSSEELRQQLGDRMPVAMSLAAKSMNMDMSSFMKKLDEGKIHSKDFIIPFSNALRTMVRESGSLDASLLTVQKSRERMQSVFKIVTSSAFDKTSAGFTTFFESLTRFLESNTKGFESLGSAIGGFFKGLSVAIDIITPVFTLVTAALGVVTQAFEDAFDLGKRADDLGGITRLLRILGGAVLALVGSFQFLSAKIQKWTLELSNGGTVGQGVLLGLAAGAALLIARFSGIFWILKKIRNVYKSLTGKGAGVGPGKSTGTGLGKIAKGGMMANVGSLLKFIVTRHPVAMAAMAAGTAVNYGTSMIRDDGKTATDLLFDSLSPSNETKNSSVIVNTVEVSVENPVAGSPSEIGLGIGQGLSDSLTSSGALS